MSTNIQAVCYMLIFFCNFLNEIRIVPANGRKSTKWSIILRKARVSSDNWESVSGTLNTTPFWSKWEKLLVPSIEFFDFSSTGFHFTNYINVFFWSSEREVVEKSVETRIKGRCSTPIPALPSMALENFRLLATLILCGFLKCCSVTF